MPKIEDPDRDTVQRAVESWTSEVGPQARARGLGFSVHAKAKEMLEVGYRGEGVRNDQTLDYIQIAAANPRVEDGMTEQVYRWWHVVNVKFEAWKARKQLGITESEDVL